MGQLILETTPIDDSINSTTEYYYDRNGNLTKTVQSTGDGTTTKTLLNIYDNRNRLIAVNDGSNYYTRYEYDNGSRIKRMATGIPTLTETLDREAHSVTDYEYSDLGHLIKVTDPMGYNEHYTNNSNGVVLSYTDKNGTVINYTYDGLFRILNKTASNSTGTPLSVSYTYDLLGNTTQMLDENGSTLYTYDMLGNVLSETRGTLVKEYEYDSNGNRTAAAITDGAFEHSLSYVYDANNRLTKVTDENGYTNYTYDNNNRVLTKKSYNSAKSATRAYTVYTYYDSGLLNTKKNYKYSTTSPTYLVDTYTLTYYADGNTATVDNSGVVTAYVYDNANRLISESIDNTVQASYTYDARGNRATKTTAEGVTTYTYDKNNCLLSDDTLLPDGTHSVAWYDYDNNGKLIEDNFNAIPQQYEYNLFGNLLRSYTTNNVTIATYTYDGNGTRLSKTVGNTTTSFINDDSYVIGEICGDNIVTYTYGTDLISINNNGTLGYYFTDEHGNVTAISDINRTIVADYDFDSFGNETLSTSTYYNPMRYCGEYYDSETGLIYLRARYYDPSIGRFISEDPIKDGTNWYVYCSNNPVAFVDPSGLALEILGTAQEIVTIYNNLLLLTDDSLSLNAIYSVEGEGLGLYEVSISNEKTGKNITGTNLLRKIINDTENSCLVMTGLNYTTTNDHNGEYDSFVTVNLEDVPELTTHNLSTGKLEETQTPIYIGLAHELIHTERFFRGVNIKGPKVSYKHKYEEIVNFFGIKIPLTRTVKGYARAEELATVGLGYNTDSDITENLIRKEHGLPLRGAY